MCGGSHLTSDLQVSSLVDKFSVLMVLSLHFQLGESFDDLLHFLSFKIHGSLILFSCCKSWDERFLLSRSCLFFNRSFSLPIKNKIKMKGS